MRHLRYLTKAGFSAHRDLRRRTTAAQDDFDGWNLEPGLNQAQLVMVARVVSISRVTIIEGAKTDLALREYRFQPVRRLKGLFQRDQLSMTASDLGLRADDASLPPPLKEGELRLLILAQQGGSAFGGLPSFGCVAAAPGATTFEQRVPLVTGPDDPLVAAAETLIKVADSRSRRERATLLIDRLIAADGLAAVPLLSSLKLRADWAAPDERAYPALARLARSPLPAVRGAALEALRETLANRIKPADSKQLDAVAESLQEMIESEEAMTSTRVAALEALGNVLAMNPYIATWPRDLLIAQMNDAATTAERSAAATAVSQIPEPPPFGNVQPEVHDALLKAYGRLPLDEAPERESIYARALARHLPGDEQRAANREIPQIEQAIINRLKRSIAARQSLEAEVDALGRIRSLASFPLLLTAAEDPKVSAADRSRIAWALGRLGDGRAAPLLAKWLRGDDFQLKETALAALEKLDSQSAADEVRPLLKLEAHLPFKLRIARLLARQGLNDGYSLATEHLADAANTAQAALVLAALDDPRTVKDLTAIVAARPDRRWHAAALTGLMALGNREARKEVLEILADDRHPLAADAAEAVGLSADAELLKPLANLVRSRNKQIAMASLIAVRRFLSGVRTSPRGLAVDLDSVAALKPAADVPSATRTSLFDAVAALVADAYVDTDVRLEALAVARLLRGDGYAKLLSTLADQAELEGGPLFAVVQTDLRNLRRDGKNADGNR